MRRPLASSGAVLHHRRDDSYEYVCTTEQVFGARYNLTPIYYLGDGGAWCPPEHLTDTDLEWVSRHMVVAGGAPGEGVPSTPRAVTDSLTGWTMR